MENKVVNVHLHLLLLIHVCVSTTVESKAETRVVFSRNTERMEVVVACHANSVK